MYSLRNIAILLTLFFCSSEAWAQCDPPDLLPSTLCEVSPAICLPGACYSTVNIPDEGHAGFCGPGTLVHNPQYIAFTAISPNVSITVQVGDCTGPGTALQMALIDTCVWDETNVIDCNGAGTPEGGTFTMDLAGAIVDSVYYILFDGSSGAFCNYEILSATGVLGPPINGDLNSATTSDLIVCQGQDNFLASAEPAIPDAPMYAWDLPWGEVITSVNNFDIEVPEDAPLGTHTVCVIAFSGCDTVDTSPCFDFTVVAIADDLKPAEIFCPEDLPFDWHGVSINGPGNYNATFDNAAGCPFDSLWTVMVHPDVVVGNLDTVHCGFEVEYETITYTTDGTYDLFYPGQGLNGCDSNAQLNVILVDLEAELDFICENGEFIISPTITVSQPANATMLYQWFNNAGATIMAGETDPELVTIDGGSYTLMITMSINGRSCEFVLPALVINPSILVPPMPDLTHGDTIICPNVLGVYTATNFDPDVIEFVWNGTGPGSLIIQDDGSGMVEIDFGGATGPSEICVHAINDCGEGLPTCFTVELQQIPTVDIDGPLTVCVDSLALFQFNGEASIAALYTWSFNGGTIVSGPPNGIGEGPYEISWDTPGIKNVIVQVAEVGCDTVSQEIDINVEQMAAPVVQCVSTIDEITFYWDALPDVLEYVVVVSGNPNIAITDTFYTISGLAPNDSITFIITALGLNTCYSELVISGCRTESCAEPTIQIIGEDSICLNGALATYDLNALANGLSVEGTWTGAGIVDAANGIFDPTDASSGAGIHALLFTYIESPLCTFTQNYTITVFDFLDAPFTVDPVICIDDVSNITFTGTSFTGAEYNWTFDNGTIISGTDPSGPYEIQWASAGDKQLSLTVSNNGCTSATTILPVTVQPTLNAPIVNCLPNTTDVEFSWADVANSSGFIVDVLQGPAGAQIGNSISFNGLVPGDIVIIEITTLSVGFCPSLIDTFQCEARICPTPTITLTEVNPICLDANTQNIDLIVDVQNGNGSGEWSGNGVIDGVLGIFQPDAADAGVGLHPILYTYNDDGCTFLNNINIEVNETPEAIISNTAVTLNCSNGNEIILDGSTSFPASGLLFEWSVVSGLGSIVGANGAPMATINTEGTYQLKVTTPSGCVDSTEIIIGQDAGNPTADAGQPNTLTCTQNVVALGGASSDHPTIRYQWTTSNGSIDSDPTLRMIDVSTPGTYTIIVTDNANGCMSSDDVMVAIDTISPTLAIDNPQMLDCDTESFELNGQVTNGLTNFSILWQADASGILMSGGTSLTPTIGASGIYTLEVTNTDNGCKSTRRIEVFEDDSVISDLDIEIGDVLCNGYSDGYLESVAISGGTAPFQYLWSNGDTTEMLENLEAGEYILLVTDANGCSFEKSVTVQQPDRLDVNLSANLNKYQRDDEVIITLDINQDIGTITDIEFVYGLESLCQNETSCTFIAVNSDTIFVYITDENGCTAEEKIFIEVKQPRIVFVPNTFTPNADGINDYFNLFAKDIVANIEFMEIYSRWGEKIFYKEGVNANNENDGWDGEINGTPVEPGVYVYRMKVTYLDGAQDEILKGDITLLR